MSKSDLPAAPLTRRQLRELRLTGALPVLDESESRTDAAPSQSHLPRAADPAPVATEVPAEASIDLGVAPLTRKQARAQEKLRTASIPVISAEEAAAAAASKAAEGVAESDEPAASPHSEPEIDAQASVGEAQASDQPKSRLAGLFSRKRPAATSDETSSTDDEPEHAAAEATEVLEDLDGAIADASPPDVPETPDERADGVDAAVLETSVAAAASPPDVGTVEHADGETAAVGNAEPGLTSLDELLGEEREQEDAHDPESRVESDAQATTAADPLEGVTDPAGATDESTTIEPERAIVSPLLGADVREDVIVNDTSFDDLITASDTAGSQHAAPSALIFNDVPGSVSLTGPVTATGEVLITGTYEFPRGMGSQGHAPGTTDGKEVDAVLLDKELAPHASPKPVAASSAISTIKPAGEVIRQPAPEKSNKLIMSLAITAGGLVLALTAALVVAFTSGVF